MIDKYVKVGEYRGYAYCIRRTGYGTVCCYIDVQQNAFARAAYMKFENGAEYDYDLFPMHGGITYFHKGFPVDEAVGAQGMKGDIVVGCDYAHFGDTRPGITNISISIISESDAERETKAVIDIILEKFDL